MDLLVGQCLQYVHLIKKKINLIITEEKVVLKSYAKKYREKKEIIPLTQEEINCYNEQEICYICKEKLFLDRNDANYANKKG